MRDGFLSGVNLQNDMNGWGGGGDGSYKRPCNVYIKRGTVFTIRRGCGVGWGGEFQGGGGRGGESIKRCSTAQEVHLPGMGLHNCWQDASRFT